MRRAILGKVSSETPEVRRERRGARCEGGNAGQAAGGTADRHECAEWRAYEYTGPREYPGVRGEGRTRVREARPGRETVPVCGAARVRGAGTSQTRGEGLRDGKCRSGRRTGIPEMIQWCLFGAYVVHAVRRLYSTATNVYFRVPCAIAWGASFSDRYRENSTCPAYRT
jgi:hypothetical protein